MNFTANESIAPHTISIVIPVYNGEATLPALVAEVLKTAALGVTPQGSTYVITEIVLVYDNGADRSAATIRNLADTNAIVRPIWLSRNFGQHAATLAGVSSSSGEWIVTLDEDGQHDPNEIGNFLDIAIQNRAQVVYARPTNPPPHGRLRNWASRSSKTLATRLFLTTDASQYNSYRLMLGSVARGMAAYAGAGAYFDVALGWVTKTYATAPTRLRGETRRSGYSLRKLVGHFWRLVISSGTRSLRIVSFLGMVLSLIGVLVVIWVVIARLSTGIDAEGWTSTIVVLLLTSGAILFSLGVIAEYVGVNVNMAMGKPAYLIVSDPADGPLGRGSRATG